MPNAELSGIQRVYILPMSSAFDHYLANRLREVSSIRIVTDPVKADAYLTDRLGASFEDKLKEFEDKAAEATRVRPEPGSDEALKEEAAKAFQLAPRMTSSIGRGKGTVFLVDRQSRNVVWSIYEKPKDMTPRTLDRTAGRVAEAFRKAYLGK
jgi:hypothetical protein